MGLLNLINTACELHAGCSEDWFLSGADRFLVSVCHYISDIYWDMTILLKFSIVLELPKLNS
jgi:hypothetical protein